MNTQDLQKLFDNADAFFQRKEEAFKARQESDDGWDRENRLNEIMSRPEYHEMGS